MKQLLLILILCSAGHAQQGSEPNPATKPTVTAEHRAIFMRRALLAQVQQQRAEAAKAAADAAFNDAKADCPAGWELQIVPIGNTGEADLGCVEAKAEKK